MTSTETSQPTTYDLFVEALSHQIAKTLGADFAFRDEVADRVINAMPVDSITEQVAENIDEASIATHMDCEEVARHVDIDGWLDMSEIATNVDHSEIADHIDYSEIADHIDNSDVAELMAEDVAQHIIDCNQWELLKEDCRTMIQEEREFLRATVMGDVMRVQQAHFEAFHTPWWTRVARTVRRWFAACVAKVKGAKR